MQARFRIAAIVAAFAIAGITASGSFARHYVEGGLAPATASQTAGGGGSTSGGAAGQSGASDNGSTTADPEGSVKKGKGYCVGENDGDPITCPSHKKAAKKGKGWDTP
jgi:hypothetical protein